MEEFPLNNDDRMIEDDPGNHGTMQSPAMTPSITEGETTRHRTPPMETDDTAYGVFLPKC